LKNFKLSKEHESFNTISLIFNKNFGILGNIDMNKRQCINCGTTSTTLWRREHKSGDYLCNDCGIYQREHGGENRWNLIKIKL